MQPILQAHGIRMVALSKDTVKDAARHKTRDGLTMTLLSDPELEVIGQYGLVHQKAVEFSKAPTKFMGLPVGMYTGKRSMAIPTTLLVDEHGAVQWIDQADDYRLRGDAARVEAAIKKAFG